MLTFRQYIEEAFDKPYFYVMKHYESSGAYEAKAKLIDGSMLEVIIRYLSTGRWEVEFTRNGSTRLTGSGHQMRVFATVIAIIREFIKKESPDEVIFSAEKDEGNKKDKTSREKLYSRMVKRFASQLGYNSKEKSQRQSTVYILTKKG